MIDLLFPKKDSKLREIISLCVITIYWMVFAYSYMGTRIFHVNFGDVLVGFGWLVGLVLLIDGFCWWNDIDLTTPSKKEE